MMKKLLFVLVLMSLALFSCEEKDPIYCDDSKSLRGRLYNETALADFPLCGTFELQAHPDIVANVNGDNRIIGKKYVFENEGVPFESVYYVRGEVAIYTKDSADYNATSFSFEFAQIAIPQTNTFENGHVVVEFVIANDKNKPSYQGPVQYIDWINWALRFEKAANTDRIIGSFSSERGTFWIPGPASNSGAGLDLIFTL